MSAWDAVAMGGIGLLFAFNLYMAFRLWLAARLAHQTSFDLGEAEKAWAILRDSNNMTVQCIGQLCSMHGLHIYQDEDGRLVLTKDGDALECWPVPGDDEPKEYKPN